MISFIMLGLSSCSVRTLSGLSIPPPHFLESAPPRLVPYLYIVVLLPHVFISQKLTDAVGLPPCRKEERAGRR